jgi:hypothetical protein
MSTPLIIGADIKRSLNVLSRNVKTATRQVAKDAAKIAREEARAAAVKAAGPDRRFSNFKGPALDVAVKYDDDSSVTIRPKGPWKIAEEGAAPHGGHPGTRSTQGRRRWSESRDSTIDRLDKDAPKVFDKAFESGFRA